MEERNSLVPTGPSTQPSLNDAGGNDLTPQEQEIAMRLWRFFASGPLKQTLETLVEQLQPQQDPMGGMPDTDNDMELGEANPMLDEEMELGQEEEMLATDEEDIGAIEENNAPEGETEEESEFGTSDEQETDLTEDEEMADKAKKPVQYQSNDEVAQLKAENAKLKAEKISQEALLHLSSVTTYALPPEQAGKVAAISTKLSETDRKSLFEILASVKPVVSGKAQPSTEKVEVYQGDATTAAPPKVSAGRAYTAQKMVQEGKARNYQEALKLLGGDE